MIDKLKRISVIVTLIAIIVGVLAVYRSAAEALPSHLYTPEAIEFITANETRRIYQLAPTWNLLGSAYPGLPMSFPGQESCVVATLHARFQDFENTTVTLYDLAFRGEYVLAHSGPDSLLLEVYFPFPSNLQTLHEVTFLVDGEEPEDVSYGLDGIRWQSILEPGDERRILVAYQADGASSFTYALQHGTRADVEVKILIDGLSGSQVPSTSLAASSIDAEGESEVFTWAYKGLIPDRDIQVWLPTGRDLTQRLLQLQGDFRNLAAAAPFLVALYVMSLAGVFHFSGVRLRVEGYLLAGLAAALYFPALTFLSAVVPLIAAFALAFSSITGLVLAFLAAMAGRRRTWWRGGLVSVACLGLLSFGLLTPWRGLSASLGGSLLVGTFMLLLVKHRAASPLQPVAGGPMGNEPETHEVLELPSIPQAPGSPDKLPSLLYCPHCGHVLELRFRFCPGCGQDTLRIGRCRACGYAQVGPADSSPQFCLSCGTPLEMARDEGPK